MDLNFEESRRIVRRAAAARLKSFLRNPKNKHIREELKEEYRRIKEVGPSAVSQSKVLTTLSIKYKNGAYIGSDILPVVHVPGVSGEYYTYGEGDQLSAPDDLIGNRSEANEISQSRSTQTYSLKDRALKDFVSMQTLKVQDDPLDEMADMVAGVADRTLFARELRQAAILTDTANFGSGQYAGAAAVWENPAAGNPIIDIQTGLAALWEGEGPSEIVGYCSLDVANALSRHDKVRDLFKYVAEGLGAMKQIATYLGLKDIKVSSARKQTANEGQTASYSRLYGKVFGLARVAENAHIRNASFGYTFEQDGDPVVNQWFDPRIGKAGGYYAQVGRSEDIKIVARKTGYLITGAIT